MNPSLALLTAALSMLPVASGGAQVNFTTGGQAAAKFGVHEITLAGDEAVANPFDTMASVVFTAPLGVAKTVQAFYDGENIWRARVYVNATGEWRWVSHSATGRGLDKKQGAFTAADSKLRGRLLPHPQNPRQWITEDGRWFLNLSDTAYFLLSPRDGNGGAVSDEDVLRYVRDDVAHGINYGGRWWVVQPSSDTGTRTATYHKRPAVTFTQPLTGLDSVKAIRDCFTTRQIDLGGFQPDHALVKDADGADGARAPKLMRRSQQEYLIYHPNAAADGKEARADTAKTPGLLIDLSAAGGRFAVEWYRAEDGQSQAEEDITGGTTVKLVSPWPGQDVVLRLLARK